MEKQRMVKSGKRIQMCLGKNMDEYKSGLQLGVTNIVCELCNQKYVSSSKMWFRSLHNIKNDVKIKTIVN